MKEPAQSVERRDEQPMFVPDNIPEVLYSLVTDEGAKVVSTPSAPTTDDPDGSKRKSWRESDDKKHKAPPSYVVDESALSSPVTDTNVNCHGTTFGGGDFFIDPDKVDLILKDNYLKVDIAKGQKARVCDIIVWGDPARHSATIVEVDTNGKPTMVIGKNNDRGRLWAHPPDDYGADWMVHERRGPLDAATSAQVDTLRKDYDEAKKRSDDAPGDEDLRKKAHLAAYRLCRRKNKLKQKSP